MTTDDVKSNRPQPAGADRRRHERFNVEWAIKVEIMIPEETFRPQAINGILKNFSKSGMLIYIDGIDQNLYRKMLVKQRYMKAHLQVPEMDFSLEIAGKVVWVDYHTDGIPEPFCNVGLTFEPITSPEAKQMDKLIANIRNLPFSSS